MKKTHVIVTALLASAIALFLMFIAPAGVVKTVGDMLGLPEAVMSTAPSAEEAPSAAGYDEINESAKARFTVIDVGQGSAMLMESGGEFLLFDGGDNAAADVTVAVLKKRGVERIKYIVASHYDSDHIGGIVGALKNFAVDNVIMPDYEPEESRTYSSLLEAIKERDVNTITPVPGDEYTCGNAVMLITGPMQRYKEENANSVAAIIRVCGQRVFIGGDATAESERDMTDAFNMDSDVVVINHHGSSSSSALAFIKETSPVVSIISCGKNNDFHHPTAKTLDTIKRYSGSLYRTDIQGDINFAVSDDGLAFEQEPCNDYDTRY